MIFYCTPAEHITLGFFFFSKKIHDEHIDEAPYLSGSYRAMSGNNDISPVSISNCISVRPIAEFYIK